MRIIETKVYKFNELSEKAKEKAILNLYSVNVDYPEWYEDDYLHEIAKEYGLEISFKGMYFNIDRGQYLYFSKNSIGIFDEMKFCKKAGVEYNPENYISVYIKYYGGVHAENYIASDYEEDDKLNDCLKEFTETLLSAIEKDYEYRTSEEAIIETIEANDYEFTEEGELI